MRHRSLSAVDRGSMFLSQDRVRRQLRPPPTCLRRAERSALRPQQSVTTFQARVADPERLRRTHMRTDRRPRCAFWGLRADASCHPCKRSAQINLVLSLWLDEILGSRHRRATVTLTEEVRC
jgi:hypothetical protein